MTLSLPSELSNYSPRACDCDFCMERNISYISHPEGSLTIQSKDKLLPLQQGQKQASFLSCIHCNDVVAVVRKFSNLNKGAINATLLKDFHQMKEPQIISPKLLPAKEKVERWNSLWLTVKIEYVSNM